MADTSQTKLSEDFIRLYESKDFADFTFISSDGLELPPRRQVLAACSNVFLRMLSTRNSREVLTGRCEVTDVDGSTMRLLLRYLYGSFAVRSDLTVEEVLKLLVAADKYEVLTMGSAYAMFLEERLTVANSVDILIVAERDKLVNLKTAALDLIAKNRQEFFTGGYLEMLKSNSPELIQDVLKSPYKVFSVSAISSEADKKELFAAINQLGGIYLDTSQYEPTCTNLIIEAPFKGE